MDNKLLVGLQKRIKDYENMKVEKRRQEEEESKRRIEEAKRRQEEEEANRKFEREARVIYSGTSREGKTTIYEYEGKYYVGERKYEQGRGAYGRIEFHLSNTEKRKEITEEQIEVYKGKKEEELKMEREQQEEQKRREEEESKRIIEEAKRRQEEAESSRKFEREARVVYSGTSKEGKITIYEYEGKYYVGERKYEQGRGAYGRIEFHLSNTEKRKEITEEQIGTYVKEQEHIINEEKVKELEQKKHEEEERMRITRQEEENRKFEREARVIYSGTSREGKITIYEYEGKYYVGERKYEQGRGAYGRIEFHLSNTEKRKEITEEQIEVYKGKKEEELKMEREQQEERRRREEEESKRRIEEAKRRQEEAEANRKFEREARVIHSLRTEDSKVSLYEYEGKYYVGERKYEQGRGAYGRIEFHLSNAEERSEITEEQIIQLFGNIELQPAIRDSVDEKETQKTKDDMLFEERDTTDLSGQQKSRISFNSIRQAIKKVLGRGER